METSYRSAMRVVDDPSDKQFPRARTCIPDAAHPMRRNRRPSWRRPRACCCISARDSTPQRAMPSWRSSKAINGPYIPALAGIHCAALQPQEFPCHAGERGLGGVVAAERDLVLYGGTTDIKSARVVGLDIALGSDWSPSGSKNLLNELKVAKIANDVLDIGLADRDIVAMVTSTPTRIVKWDGLVGSVSAGRRTDFIVIAALASADPYGSLINARGTDLVLTVIDRQPGAGNCSSHVRIGRDGRNRPAGQHNSHHRFTGPAIHACRRSLSRKPSPRWPMRCPAFLRSSMTRRRGAAWPGAPSLPPIGYHSYVRL